MLYQAGVEMYAQKKSPHSWPEEETHTLLNIIMKDLDVNRFLNMMQTSPPPVGKFERNTVLT